VALTKAHTEIAPKVPTGNLLSPRILLSLLVHITFQVIAQVTMFLVLKAQSWCVPPTTARERRRLA